VARKHKLNLLLNQSEILSQVRQTLAEHFDCGIVIVSWEQEGETYHMHAKHGNEYACKSLADEAECILWPEDEDEDEDQSDCIEKEEI